MSVTKKDKKEVPLCKGKTLKGSDCTRKGAHTGYCLTHLPTNLKSKEDKLKSDKPKKTKIESSNIKKNKKGVLPFKGMIGKAVFSSICATGLGCRKGASRPHIKKYLQANFNIPPTHHMINSTLTKMTKNGELVVNPQHTGHYRLSPAFKILVENL